MRVFFLLFLITTGAATFAQKALSKDTIKVSLPDLNMEYVLPKTWETKPFFNLDWETPGGNNLCPCAGVLNYWKIPGGGDFDYIYMAAYPSDRKHINAEKRQSLWQYHFVFVEKVDTVKTDWMVWERRVSKLKPIGSVSGNRFKDYTVYRYEGHFGSTYYLMYLWAKPYMLQIHKEELDAIVGSFKAIK
jgi:hypothetical protein